MNYISSRNIRTTAVILIVVALIVLALGGFLNPLLRITLSPFVLAQTWLSERYMALYEFFTMPRDVASLRQQNAELEGQVSGLQSQVIQLQQQLAEAQIANALVDFARARPENQYVAASVIGRDSSPFLHYIFINRGSDDGVLHGMPVVVQQGLVGRVDAVTPNAARVQLISDPGAEVNVRLQVAQTEAVLNGSVTGDITLQMLPRDLQITNGDIVLTSGLGGNYPPNILIGQVVGTRRQETELFQEATVQTAVDFTTLKVVLVIVNFKPLELAPLQPTPAP